MPLRAGGGRGRPADTPRNWRGLTSRGSSPAAWLTSRPSTTTTSRGTPTRSTRVVDNVESAVLGQAARRPPGADLPGLGRAPARSRTCRAPARRCWPARWPSRSTARSPASSSRPTCCPPTSPASRSTTRRTASSPSTAGPIFHSIVLADEINRASPKTQSALLEVMEEGHVTVDGQTHDVGRPFMVIATQNPIEQAGTYQLPEAQLDRFLMRTSLGHPDAESTEALLAESRVRDRAAGLTPVVARGGDRADGPSWPTWSTSTAPSSATSAGWPRPPRGPRRPDRTLHPGCAGLDQGGEGLGAGRGSRPRRPRGRRHARRTRCSGHRLLMASGAAFGGATPDAGHRRPAGAGAGAPRPRVSIRRPPAVRVGPAGCSAVLAPPVLTPLGRVCSALAVRR